MYNPFTEVGRLAGEVSSIERQISDCVKRWELENIRNKIQEIKSNIQRVESNINELQNNFAELKARYITNQP